MPYEGILNIDKPEGSTSFEIVTLVRKLSGVRKVGHAGTLDPIATGVLLVCLGQAARVSEFIMDLPKRYRGTIHLGIATDTYDSAGRPVLTRDASAVNENDLKTALQSLARRRHQVPPPYSAIKLNGTRAYNLARMGRPVNLKPRKAAIERITLLSFEPPAAEIEVECGKGTYIRSVANDLGLLLGCGAHLRALRRISVGQFTVEDSLSRGQLEAAFRDGTWQNSLVPKDLALSHMPAAHLDADAEAAVLHGRPISTPPSDRSLPYQNMHKCRAYGEDGGFLAILYYDASAHLWRPQKVFAPSNSAV